MPLTKLPDDTAIEDARIGIGFLMMNGETAVRVWVDKGALDYWRNSTAGAEMAEFQKQRSLIETVASTNYDDGIIEPDGSTIIRREDTAAFA